MTYRLAPMLLVCACAHAPAAPLPVDLPARLATALDVAALIVEVQVADAGEVGCVLAPVAGASLRTGAGYLRGSGTLPGFTVDPTACGVVVPSVALPSWLGAVWSAVSGMLGDLPCSLAAPLRYALGAGDALTTWARDTSQPVNVPAGEVCP
jgi:hypothetical protein